MERDAIIEKVVEAMRDTDDPVNGTVLEKTAEVDFGTFCAFVLTQRDDVTMKTVKDAGKTVYLFYTEESGHVASYIEGRGYFGGERIGSENTMYNNTGAALVKSPFRLRGKEAEAGGGGCRPFEGVRFDVLTWVDDEECNGPIAIDVLKAVSEYHAVALLNNRIGRGKYPQGTWLEYTLNGEKTELGAGGRFGGGENESR